MALLGDIKIMMLKGEKGDKGDGSYDDTEIRGMIAQETADREEEIAEMERNFLNYLYPVGSIYMTVSTTSPAVLFGGTWEQIKDKFLLACGDTYNNGETGGVDSITYTPNATVKGHVLTVYEMPEHNHGYVEAVSVGGHTLTDSEIPPHTHNYNKITINNSATSPNSALVDIAPGNTGLFYTHQEADVAMSSYGPGYAHSHPLNKLDNASTQTSGANNAHSHAFEGVGTTLDNMPPYLAVNVWKRTA